ncbi:MAG: sugar-binding domain-containing protein [Bacteroidota bacterium]
MKKLFIASQLIFSSVMAQDQVLNWTVEHAVTKEVLDAGTHGSVQEILIKKGELPDPFYGKNEEKFGWIENHTWEFESTFTVDDTSFQNDFLELIFPFVDVYAELYLNDSLLGVTQNAFRPYRFEVKSLLKHGENKIRAKFYPPVLFHKEMYEKANYHLPAPNDVHEIAIAPYTRKPQYQFGWDWSLRMNTIGFMKPVSLNASNGIRVVNKNVVTRSIDEQLTATIDLELHLIENQTEDLIWKSKLFGESVLRAEKGVIRRSETIDKAQLWWPRGHGDQHLYNDEWTISTIDGKVIYSSDVRFGIKQSKLINEKDQWGTNYEIWFNNKPIFCKGGDYIPQDVFPARVKDEDLRKMVEQLAATNFNMVRVWGGGYYPDDAFFEACDELGIMVWQDFMFACAMYPGNPDFLLNVQEEIEYQIPRIASHPSVTIFNGNNEVSVAWKYWGFQVRYNIYGKDADEVQASYDRLFKELIPTKVNQFSAQPYIHTSPLSHWGKDEFYDNGSQHYWGVWHGKDPMEDFAKKIGRFNAEYGFQSFPEYSTLLNFSTKDQWSLQSDVMKHHQKSYVGNLMIEKHANLLYGKAENFEQFIYLSQLTQSHAVSIAVSGHRLNFPRCMGTLYWQVNDVWSAPTWSSIDYYWNWKALNYHVKKDYEDVAILRKEPTPNQFEYYLISDVPQTFTCKVHFEIFDLKGKKLAENHFKKVMSQNENMKICLGELAGNYANQNVVVKFKWTTAEGKELTRDFSQLPIAYNKAGNDDSKISIHCHDSARKEMTIKVDVKRYVRNFWLFSEKAGLQFDDNFVDLLPGDHFFKIKYEGEAPSLESFGFQHL